MNKLPYEMVSIEVDKLMKQLVSAQSDEEVDKIWDQYNAYLEAAGWTSHEFDIETSKRVDENWDSPIKEKSVKKQILN